MSKRFNVKVHVFSPEELLAKKVGAKLQVPAPAPAPPAEHVAPVSTIPAIELAPPPVETQPVVESTPAHEPINIKRVDNIAQEEEPDAPAPEVPVPEVIAPAPVPEPVKATPKPRGMFAKRAGPATAPSEVVPTPESGDKSRVIGAALLGLSLLALAGIRQ